MYFDLLITIVFCYIWATLAHVMQVKTIVKEELKDRLIALQKERNHATISSLIRELIIIITGSKAKNLQRNINFKEIKFTDNMLRVNLSGLLLRDYLIFCNDNQMDRGRALHFILVKGLRELTYNKNLDKK